MKEQEHPDHNQQQRPLDLEQRLSSYYGPPLREQPLSTASWQNLRLQLPPQKRARRRYHVHWPFSFRRSPANIPPAFLQAFVRIAYEARMPYTASMLRCRYTLRSKAPEVHSSWLGRPVIRLLLPLNTISNMGQAEQEVLLATGLARSVCLRKPGYTLVRLLLMVLVLIACLLLALLWIHHSFFIGLSSAVVLCALTAWLLHIQTRTAAFRADALMVLWLGRSRVCSGLHAWADHSRASRRQRWGEPSLA